MSLRGEIESFDRQGVGITGFIWHEKNILSGKTWEIMLLFGAFCDAINMG